MKPRRWAFALVGTALAGCAGTAPAAQERVDNGQRARDTVAQAPAVDHVVAASWVLGLEALRADDDDTGAVVSPSSLVSALTMLGEGAQGDEGAPFDHALGGSAQDRTDAVNALLTALQRYEGDPAVVREKHPPQTPVVHTAQRVVVDDDVTVAPAFLDRLQRGFGAGVLVTDLGSSSGKKALDAWVRENTGGLVEHSAVRPEPSLVSVLQDAVTLAAAWQHPFLSSGTHDAPFTLPDGDGVRVPTMHAALSTAAIKRDGWLAVRLPYTADLYADVLLPPAHGALARDPARVEPRVLTDLVDGLDSAPQVGVLLALPKTELRTTTDLVNVLAAAGLDGSLTGIRADGSPVTVAQAAQQAVLLVDEEGTRAAAVTELAEAGAGPPTDQIEMVVDRPFLLAVQDGTTGWPVFLAAVKDPRG